MTPPVAAPAFRALWRQDSTIHRQGAGMSAGCYAPILAREGWVRAHPRDLYRAGVEMCPVCLPDGLNPHAAVA